MGLCIQVLSEERLGSIGHTIDRKSPEGFLNSFPKPAAPCAGAFPADAAMALMVNNNLHRAHVVFSFLAPLAALFQKHRTI